MRLLATRSFGIPRRWSNQVLERIAPLFEGDIINVSGWDDRDKQGRRYRDYFSSATHYFVSNTRGYRGLADSEAISDFEIDLTKPLPDGLQDRFDVVFNHTTLEHIAELEVAFQRLSELTRDILIVVVPFAQQLHLTPSYGDYWRFTPMGLQHLMERNGLQVVYENASLTPNAGIYVLVVGSKAPGRWNQKLPQWSRVETLGNWIGGRGPAAFWRRLLNLVLRKLGAG